MPKASFVTLYPILLKSPSPLTHSYRLNAPYINWVRRARVLARARAWSPRSRGSRKIDNDAGKKVRGRRTDGRHIELRRRGVGKASVTVGNEGKTERKMRSGSAAAAPADSQFVVPLDATTAWDRLDFQVRRRTDGLCNIFTTSNNRILSNFGDRKCILFHLL